MKLRNYLDVCATAKGYNQTKGKVDWKIENGVAFFRQSKEAADWIRNILAVIPWIVKINGWRIIPLGAWLTYRQIRFLKDRQDFVKTCGISQGGWAAIFLAFETNKIALTFGSPGDSLKGLSGQFLRYENPNDIICKLPLWAVKSGEIRILKGFAERPDDMPELEWNTGHTINEYRQRVGE